jgi:hypothetical protein
MRRVIVGGMAAVLLVSLALAAPAAAARPADVVRVHLAPKADLGADGNITGSVRVSCPAGLQILEAGVTLSQDDQAIFGQGFIDRITCDGKQRWYRWRAFWFDQPFHTGAAYVSAFVIVTDENFEDTVSGGDTRIVRVR